MTNVDGVLVVDKPAGPTSHDVVRRLRRILGQRRIGHTGTLDPFATGVLPLCVGRATRLSRFLSADDKLYRGTVRLGYATSTDDRLGEPLDEYRAPNVPAGRVQEECARLTGRILQRPPSFSAKRVGGQRMHELARRGAPVDPAAVAVTVHRLDVIAVTGDEVEIEVLCSAGTYVRAIARDLGEALGCGGHLTSLRRLRSGCFGLDGAVGLEGLERGKALQRLTPLRALLPQWPSVVLDDAGIQALRNGRDLKIGRFQGLLGTDMVRVLDASGELLALATPRQALDAPGLEVPASLHPDIVLMDVRSPSACPQGATDTPQEGPVG